MDRSYACTGNKTEYNNYNKGVEVLAPAGSLDICKAVINAGADAVYLGGDMFGARAYAGNLNKEEMFEALDYAHTYGRHIYLTVNTLLKQSEIDGQLIDYLIPFYEKGLDAVIVQDLGVMRLIRKHFPDMDIHASTQMTQTGVYGSGLLYNNGARRIVTSREMTLDEIKALHKAYPDMEIESFVHGAMCYCYSGQCLMSSFNGGRSGNRGRCAQPCRLPYKVYDDGKLISSADERYALSPKDMCAIKILPDIIDAGVYSLKIEGRMKNVTYAAYVTSIYRKYVDMYISGGRDGYRVSDKDIEDLCDIYNRGAFTTGFYNSSKGKDMMALTRPNNWGVQALMVVSNVKGKVTFRALTDINAQDVFEIDKEHSFESGVNIKKGQTMVVNLPRKYDLAPKRILNRMKNAHITEFVKKNYVDGIAQLPVDMYFKAVKNEPSELTVSTRDTYVTVYGGNVEKAAKQAATKDNIKDKLSMTGQTGFRAFNVDVMIDDDIFMPVGELKKLRREALEQLKMKLTGAYERSYVQDEQLYAECNNDDLFKEQSTRDVACEAGSSAACRDDTLTDDTTSAIQTFPSNTYYHNELTDAAVYKSVYLYNVKNINAILDIEAVKRIYIDYDIFYTDRERFTDVCRRVAGSGASLYIGLPYILAEEKHNRLCELLDYVNSNMQSMVKGFLVRNLEELGLLAARKDSGYDIVMDAGMYVFNTHSRNELESVVKGTGLNMCAYTLPYELNSSELKSVGGLNSELIVYGRVPAMVSKQCVRKTYGRCDHKSRVTLLKQDNGKEYSVKSVCSFCYTITLADTFDISKEEVLADIALGSVRYEFDEESNEEILSILNKESDIDYKGHFYRGVN